MKMSEFLALSDDEKVEFIESNPTTEDLGACSICGGRAGAINFCFGCQKLICNRCDNPGIHKCIS